MYRAMDAESIVIFVCLGFLALLIAGINSFVIYLVSKTPNLRSATNICLASLAMSDMMTGLVSIPLVITCSLTLDYRGICVGSDMLSRFISISTALHLLIVTLERYIQIVHALKYNSIVTINRVIAVLIATWTTSATVTIIQRAWQSSSDDSDANREDVIYGLSCVVGIVLVPLAIIAYSYLRIFVALRHQLKIIQRLNSPVERSTSLRKRKVERKAVTIFGCMILTFICCWFSYFMDGIREDIGSDQFTYPVQVEVFLMFLRFISALVNPLLYTFLKEDFKIAARSTLFKRDDYNRTSCIYQTDYTPSTDTPV
ncbi:histamine H2 receptor-like [Actinia tenebrosa]|uniref:Histamine H2 receptor-like n=1 Tax=Actinia tenebrosa TaxID=6105 RepID=A0A6P8IPW3_ACTTE|nr:histamine H2 receptor-like [Actinia tenebrosa]